MIALAELTFYDGKYNTINYSEADITTNSLERSEGALHYLCDDDMNTYYHSAWKYAVYTPEDYVYIDVKFPHSINSLNFTMTSHNTKLAPTKIVLTPAGVAYNGYSNPGGSDGEEENGGDASVTMKPIDVFSEEVLYVHLKDGGIDAFQKSLIDGDSYTGDGMLYIPLVDGDVVTYSDAEYDSCSTTVPQLPTLQTYKFNNKYNAKRLKTNVYFAHPYSSWEKGNIENTNKLIRQYFPKGMDFENLEDDFLYQIQKKINRRPRKKLNFSSPTIDFYKELL